LLLLLSLVVASSWALSPTCLSETGLPVDWWVIIKVPIISGSSNPNVQQGYGYLYADTSKPLALTTKTLNNALTASLGATLNQVYVNKSVSYLMYNDQTPDDNSHNSYGHLKGVMGFDQYRGFWLVHSTPRYPLGPSSVASYQGYPDYARTYGQSFLCINFAKTKLDTIGLNLVIDKPYIYDTRVVSGIQTAMPNLYKLMTKTASPPTSQTAIVDLVSVGRRTFTGFFKSAAWDSDLYEDLVQPEYGLGFKWETWQNGALTNQMPAFCPPQYQYQSLNIEDLTVSSELSWTDTKDHSKWGVSSTSTIICIGDINRQYSQSNRGGGTLCVNHTRLWSNFNNLISGTDSC